MFSLTTDKMLLDWFKKFDRFFQTDSISKPHLPPLTPQHGSLSIENRRHPHSLSWWGQRNRWWTTRTLHWKMPRTYLQGFTYWDCLLISKMPRPSKMWRWITEFKFRVEWTDVEDANVVPHPITSNLTYTTHEEYIARTTPSTDYALVCASLKGWSGENFTVSKMLFFQGDTEDTEDDEGNVVSPKGLNAVGSESFIANMKTKLGKRFVVVPSARCAEMRPLPDTSKVCPSISKMPQRRSFKLMVGRIAPGIVLAAELARKLLLVLSIFSWRAVDFNAMVSFMSLLMSIWNWLPTTDLLVSKRVRAILGESWGRG